MKLIRDDCFSALDKMGKYSVDLIVTDPPYFLPATHYNVRSGSFRSLSDLGILEHYFFMFFTKIDRVLAPNGHLYLFCDGQSYPIFYSTAYSFFKKLRPIIWDKLTSINGFSWRHQHEIILFCERPESVPVKTGDGDVLKFRAVPIKNRRHLAEKPVELLCKLIEKHNPKIVLDPYSGSASTGEACERLGVDFIGIEKDQNYFEISKQRIETAQYNKPLEWTAKKRRHSA